MLNVNVKQCTSRLDLWDRLLEAMQPKTALEVGVWKGEFAAHILSQNPSIKKYYMIDPWRNLTDWNKPINIDNQAFDLVYREAMEVTRFAHDRIAVLRGTTREVVNRIPDESLDFIYVDGDHTLRGISIDLINVYRKLKPGGYLGGDDLEPNPWRHGSEFEPTLVFPFAIYFAEAVGAPIAALGFQQFLMQKPADSKEAFAFTDRVGHYGDRSLRRQMLPRPSIWNRTKQLIPEPLRRILRIVQRHPRYPAD